ncbi:MAG TPA: FAD-binding oxidoreductase [Terriglobales bacterium]
MSLTNIHSTSELAVAGELRAVMQGRVVTRGDWDYAKTRQIWNGAVQHEPALFAVCETSDDVQAAVRSAREHLVSLSVRGGGHDWAGRSLRHGGLVIDLFQMRRVDVDPVASVATIQGGATAVDVISAAEPHGLVAATGNCGAVGMVGLTMGGGYGPLTSRYGLALDSLLGAEVVVADGRLVYCDERENPDLFWALRGGGGNFGVVTAIRMRLHRIREVLAGMMLFPWSEAGAVLRGYAEVISDAPDELSVVSGVLSAPDGSPVVLLSPMWSGEAKQGEALIARLRQLGTPIMDQVEPMPYRDWLGMFAAAAPIGRHYALQTRSVAQLTPEVISILVAGAQQRSSPFSGIIVHDFRGAATRVPVAATAFGLRTEHFVVEMIAAWEDAGEDDGWSHRQWARTVSQKLAPHALPGGYPNVLGPEEHEQTAQAYGTNASRLRAAKRLFDPDGVLTSAISLPFPLSSPLQRAA